MAARRPSEAGPVGDAGDAGDGKAGDAPGSVEARAVLADHAEINRLLDDLLPALIARLSGSGLGEIEVRQGGWKARLRKPVAVERRHSVVAAIPPSAATPSSAAGAAVASAAPSARAAAPAGGSRPAHADRHIPAEAARDEEPGLVAAKSPAVGIYTPRRDLVLGMPVRSGDRIGYVDVLGVHQDVLSPIEGVIGSSLAEAGEAVEYGQELVRIEAPGGERAAERPTPGQKATASVAGRA